MDFSRPVAVGTRNVQSIPCPAKARRVAATFRLDDLSTRAVPREHARRGKWCTTRSPSPASGPTIGVSTFRSLGRRRRLEDALEVFADALGKANGYRVPDLRV